MAGMNPGIDGHSMVRKNPVQLTLSLPFDEALQRDDFIVSEANEQALGFIEMWPEWPANVALLIGPVGSGKTHLSHIWAKQAGAQIHRGKTLQFDHIYPWLQTGALVLDDVDVFDIDEVALFHLINTVRNGDGFLLMTAEQPLSCWQLTLPDLISRLRAAVPVSIGIPDNQLMRQVFIKQFTDRQINIDPGVVNYLVHRIERSLKAVRDSVNTLDEAAFAEGRAITTRFASEILDI